MLSVCIPVFNRGVINLVSELKQQSEAIAEKIEIICIDDASEEKYKQLNKNIFRFVDRYIELEKNIGRAAIRNLFLNFVQNEYLLYIDADSLIIKTDFLETYINKLKLSKIDVLYGGRIYPQECNDKSRLLRYRYGISRESKPMHERVLNQYLSFQTNNFVIRKEVFAKIRFNENLKHYGHEDTLFAFILKRNSINIEHIDNAVLNDELETNKDFLDKTELAIQNLFILMNHLSPTEMLDIYLFKYFIRFRIFLIFMQVLIKPILSVLKWYLVHFSFLNIEFFSFYKLLYFSKMYTQIKKSRFLKSGF